MPNMCFLCQSMLDHYLSISPFYFLLFPGLISTAHRFSYLTLSALCHWTLNSLITSYKCFLLITLFLNHVTCLKKAELVLAAVLLFFPSLMSSEQDKMTVAVLQEVIAQLLLDWWVCTASQLKHLQYPIICCSFAGKCVWDSLQPSFIAEC